MSTKFDTSTNGIELHYAAVLLRLGMATLMLLAGIGKIPMGIDGMIAQFTEMFANTWLPGFLVAGFAAVIMPLELLLGVWLLSGFKLKWAWVVTGLTILSLAAGVQIVGKHDVAASNYNYLAIVAFGLILSAYDRWQIKSKA